MRDRVDLRVGLGISTAKMPYIKETIKLLNVPKRFVKGKHCLAQRK